MFIYKLIPPRFEHKRSNLIIMFTDLLSTNGFHGEELQSESYIKYTQSQSEACLANSTQLFIICD